MRGDFFDTNILVYAASTDEAKAEHATRLIESRGRASVQVLNEFVNVARRRINLDWTYIRQLLDSFQIVLDIRGVDVTSHRLALDLAERHRLHIYDATIVASALQAGCERLLTEDMQHGLVVAGRLRIENPFLSG